MEHASFSGRRLRLPGTPEDVDAEFMADILARNGLPNDVRTVTWERIGTDRGISSMVGQVRPAYAGEADGVASLIVKLASEPLTGEAATIEVDFYRRLAPQSPLQAPHCLVAIY